MILPGMRLALAGCLLAAPLMQAQAQAVYRSVGPDGRVIFSDVPPKAAPPAPAQAGTAPQAAGNTSPLPYGLRQVVDRFPVVLYTGPDCAPCETGRVLLSSRGIPFSERTVASDADAQALQKLSGERSLPLLTIGTQHLKGYSEVQWQQYLDAAGYPRSSLLPAGWKREAPQALAPRTSAAPAPAPATSQPQAEAAPALAPAPRSAPAPGDGGQRSNPAGIQF